MDLLAQELGTGCSLHTMPAKKWPWRARTSALYLSQTIPASHAYRVLFASSVLNVAELVALRPDLAPLHKVLYFHENQLVYPVRSAHERDFQYGYNQVLSCFAADVVVFNSRFNMESFLGSISGFMNTIPDHRPRDLEAAIRPKCRVLHFPIRFPPSDSRFFQGEPDDAFGSTEPDIHSPRQGDPDRTGPVMNDEKIPCAASGPSLPPPPSPRRTSGAQPLHILWPHRWEHDKNPELFFETLFKLKEAGCSFRVSVLGETYTTVPSVFEEARRRLADEILHWGFQASREDYYGVLAAADVAISTAKHEFFGVAMLEAAHCGCYPLCPDALVYPEIFPAQCLFRTPAQLLKQLRYLCARPASLRQRSDKNCFVFSLSFLPHLRLALLATYGAKEVQHAYIGPSDSFGGHNPFLLGHSPATVLVAAYGTSCTCNGRATSGLCIPLGVTLRLR
ncbi:tRNA-queuosine alpha-mannosyltransferase isoform X2 [Lampetra fluviatilis]